MKQLVEREKIIVILRGVDSEQALRTADALAKAGIHMVEYAFSAKLTNEENADILRGLCDRFNGSLAVGAGTITDVKRLAYAADAGAKYIISPDVNEAVIAQTKARGLISMPGALTPTEICKAYACGGDFVKVFPVGAMQKNYMKDVLSPLSYIPLLAVGGVNPDNILEYLQQGAVGVGIGGALADLKLITADNYEEITRRASKCVQSIHEFSQE